MHRRAVPILLALLIAAPSVARDSSPAPTPPSGSSSVEGTVRDADGAPLAGARVTGVFLGGGSVFPLRTKTDARGAYAFASLPSCRATIEAGLDGYANAERGSITIADGQRLAGFDFALAKELTIGGRITDSSGEPVQGVNVSAHPMGGGAKGGARPAGSSARSKDDGGYTIRSLGEGAYTVKTHSSDFSPTKKEGVAAGSSGVDFILKDAGGITGTVRDKATGGPVPKARVTLAGLTGRRPAARSNESGAYSLAPLDTGTYTVEAKADGYLAQKLPGVAVRAGEDTEGVDLALAPAPRIRGRVTIEGGEPGAGAGLVLSTSTTFTAFSMGVRKTPDATADASGRYEIVKGEPGSRYVVQAVMDGFIPGKSAPFQLVPGRDRDGVDIVLKKGISLSGKVADERGAPVPGARVKAVSKEGGFFFSVDGGSTASGPGTAVADKGGAFTIEGLAAGRHEVRASADGYGSGTVDVALSAGKEPKPVTIVLHAGLAVSGRVTDGDGNPLAEANVSASGQGESGHCFRSAETDEDGRYEIASLSPGRYRVSASLAGYGTGKVEDIVPPAEKVDLSLSAGGRIVGRVTDADGKPVASFTFYADKAPYSDRMILKHGTRSSADDGSFETKALAPGDYAVTVNADGYAPGRAAGIRVESGKTARAEIALGPAASIAGTVVNARDRAPVAGARVSLLKDRGDDAFEFGFGDSDLLDEAVLSDDAGSFSIGGLPAGKFRLKASHPDFAEETVPVECPREGETARVEIPLKKGRTISGIVKDGATSAPVAGAVVTISSGAEGHAGIVEKMLASMGASPRGSATSDAAGSWSLANVAPGAYRLRAAHGSYAPSAPKTVTVKPDADAAGVELVLSGGARIRGTVTDPAGKAVPRVSVHAVSAGGMAKAATDTDGRYALEHLAPGEWMVSFGRSGAGEVDTMCPVTVAAGEELLLDMTLGAGFTVSGRVLQRGEPVADARIFFSREEEGGEEISANGRSGKDGAYRIAGLPAGEYRVRISGSPGGEFSSCVLPLRISVTGDAVDKDLALPSGTIAGTVADESGKPVEGARIRLDRRSAAGEETREPVFWDKMLGFLTSKKSGPGGAFELDSVAAGTYALVAEKKGAGRADATATLASDDDRAEVALVLKPGFPLKLKAASAVTGKPVARAAVRVVGKGGERVKEEAVSAEGGVLSLPGVPAGTYRVEVGAAGCAPGKLDAVKVGPGEKAVPELKLEKGATLAAAVSTEKGAPVQGAVVELLDAAGRRYDPPCADGGLTGGGRAVAGSNGVARFDSLPAGPFTVKASKRGMKPAETKVTLKKGEETKAALALK